MIHVKKADGQIEEYDRSKLESSLARAGADENTINMIVNNVERKLYNNIASEDIYNLIYDQLQESSDELKYRYNLKKAIMQLGPTGYPFEKFLAGLLIEYGYEAQTGQILNGTCVKHEVDVLTEKNGKRSMIECKFHNHPGTKSTIKDVLYTHARFEDLSRNNHLDEAWLVTNTKVTQDAIQYARCTNMRIVSWNYPNEDNLRALVEKSGLHPITVRSDLTNDHIRKLIDQGIIFAKDRI